MGKLLSRLVIVILLVLCVYLYVQVIQLQQANKQMQASLRRESVLQAENVRLRAQLAKHGSELASQTKDGSGGGADWIAAARAHIQNAEQAVGKGDFLRAAQESRLAHDSLDNAANQASAETRQAAASLREQLTDVQARARTLWRRFGG